MSLFFQFWWISLFAKIGIATFLPFFADESYYWVWSHHLQLSYFDHPPMISWLLSFGKPLESYGHLARLPVILMSHTTLLLWKKILDRYLVEKQLVTWIALAVLNPLFGFGGLIATPDIPLLFFWSASLLVFERYVDNPKTNHAVLLGAFLGLGFCSKYHIVLFPIGIILWLTLHKKWSVVKVKHVMACIGTGVLFSAPVLLWNLMNNFDSFAFQLKHGLVKKSPSLTYPLEYFIGQLLLLFPVVLIAALQFTKTTLHRLSVWAWLPLVFFLVTSFKSRVEPNWPIMAYPAVLALAALGLSSKKLWVRSTVGVWSLALVLLVTSIFTGKPRDLFTKTKLKELTVYNDLKDLPKKYQPLYASSYQMASSLSYLTKIQVYKLAGINRKDFYDYLEISTPSDDPFYVVLRNDQTLPDWAQKDFSYKVVEERGAFHILEVTD